MATVKGVSTMVLGLILGSSFPVWAQSNVTVQIDGQAEQAPVARGLWEGQHLAFSARLMKRHEHELLRYLPLRQARTHDSDPSLDLVSLGPGRYDFTPLDQFIEDVRALGPPDASPGLLLNLEFTPRWLAEGGCAQRSPRYSRPTDWGLWAQVVEDTVRHVRQQASAMGRYYEVWNEPNIETFWMPCETDRAFARQEYFRLYRETARAVRRADPGAKVGGPSIAQSDKRSEAEEWIPSFLDYCLNNALPLDFLSFHRYEAGMPSLDTGDGLTVRAWLRARGLDNVEILNTEWNLIVDDLVPTADSEAMYGAGIPARIFSMLKGTINRSVYFAAPDAPEELIVPTEEVRPAYNVFRMLGALKGATVAAASDGLDEDGRGVGVLAAVDRTGGRLAVLLWNYRFTNFFAPPTSVRLDIRPLPDFLRNQRVTYRQYLVDSATSNWLADRSQDHLQRVEERSVRLSTNYADDLSLKPNAVTLLVFCRQDGPCLDLPSPTDYLGPIIRSVFVDPITEDSATVTWRTSRAATSKVEYGTTRAYGMETPTDTRLTTEHAVVLSGLTPGTIYYFRAVSADGAGRQTQSEDWWSLITPPRGHITRVFQPTDNTYMDDVYCLDHPDASFSEAALLSVRDTSQRAFLRFDLSAIAPGGDVNATGAELRFFAVDYGDNGGEVYRTQETSWRETEVNCYWQPSPAGPRLAALPGPVANGFSYRAAVTPAVQQGRVFSFAVTQPVVRSKVAYSSTRHASAPPPLLFVTVRAGDEGGGGKSP